MGISLSGIGAAHKDGAVSIKIDGNHPLMLLSGSLDWNSLSNLVLPDILTSTPKGMPLSGRKLQLRTHLAVFMLQKLYCHTDRMMEYQVKDNAAAQIFCGRLIVDSWRAPDHTKIETFRNRLSAETQRKLAVAITKEAVKIGYADPTSVDFDSTVQEANIAYPSDAQLLRKLGAIGKKVIDFIKKNASDMIPEGLDVDLQKICQKAKEYFFLSRNKAIEIKRECFRELLQTVKKQMKPVIDFCEGLGQTYIASLPWNIRKTLEQIRLDGRQYLLDVAHFTRTHSIRAGKILSFHAKKLACISKGKVGKALQFGRVFQLARIKGNFLTVLSSTSVHMNDKKSFSALIQEHINLFGEEGLNSATTDKGYWSKENEKFLEKKGKSTLGLQRPGKKIDCDKDADIKTLLHNRRAGIEPLIGHVKQGGQLGKSRMKSDAATLAAGYGSVLGFNLRQMTRHSQGKYQKAA